MEDQQHGFGDCKEVGVEERGEEKMLVCDLMCNIEDEKEEMYEM